MLIIQSSAAMAFALKLPLDPALKALLALRRMQLDQVEKADLGDIANFLIIHTGDTEPAIASKLGFSPLTNLTDDARYGEPNFEPSWEWIEDRGGWFELLFLLTDDGFAHVLLVENSEGVDPGLLGLCREQASNGAPAPAGPLATNGRAESATRNTPPGAPLVTN